MVNYEIKSQLAKLLATEDIIVENKNVETAQFDVHNRVLTLPRWSFASNVVYDLLVGHEVGHALFTPDEEWYETYEIPQSIVNVVEDARIEKLMKRKYPGMSKTFYNGYGELNDEDFFELEDVDINNLNLADRINLYFKGGTHMIIDFTPEEKDLIKIVGNCETFDDTLKASELLYKYCQDEKDRKDSEELEQSSDIKLKGETGSEEDYGDLEDLSEGLGKGKGEQGKQEGQDEIEETPDQLIIDPTQPWDKQSQGKGPATGSDDIEAMTDEIFNEKVSELNDPKMNGTRDNLYAQLPQVDLNKVIISNEQVNKELHDHFTSDEVQKDYNIDSDSLGYVSHNYYNLKFVDDEFNKFKKSAQKGVNYLVKEFEMKKSADAYARTAVSRTGVLDTSKLHTYKFNEDIFRKINVVPDGKNHGLIFTLDWSGSMSRCLLNTIKQLYELVWFCQKVQIPFDVYAFSTQYSGSGGYYSYSGSQGELTNVGDLVVGSDFNLIHYLTSSVNKRDMDAQLLNLWRCAYALSIRGSRYDYPKKYWLGGTPLNETFVCLHQIIPQFKKNNDVQKVQCIVLTDGEANGIPVVTEFKGHDGEMRKGTSHVGYNSFLRNRKTGHVYNLSSSYEYWKFAETMIQDLRQTFPDVNFIGIRITDKREFGSFLRQFGVNDSDVKKGRKNASFSIKNSGYHSYFAILDSSLVVDDEFEVKEDATKAQIKAAFVKSLKAKKLNKKVLSEFVELVA